jgi:hypothetical protein
MTFLLTFPVLEKLVSESLPYLYRNLRDMIIRSAWECAATSLSAYFTGLCDFLYSKDFLSFVLQKLPLYGAVATGTISAICFTVILLGWLTQSLPLCHSRKPARDLKDRSDIYLARHAENLKNHGLIPVQSLEAELLSLNATARQIQDCDLSAVPELVTVAFELPSVEEKPAVDGAPDIDVASAVDQAPVVDETVTGEATVIDEMQASLYVNDLITYCATRLEANTDSIDNVDAAPDTSAELPLPETKSDDSFTEPANQVEQNVDVSIQPSTAEIVVQEQAKQSPITRLISSSDVSTAPTFTYEEQNGWEEYSKNPWKIVMSKKSKKAYKKHW